MLSSSIYFSIDWFIAFLSDIANSLVRIVKSVKFALFSFSGIFVIFSPLASYLPLLFILASSLSASQSSPSPRPSPVRAQHGRIWMSCPVSY